MLAYKINLVSLLNYPQAILLILYTPRAHAVYGEIFNELACISTETGQCICLEIYWM
jgi:hypothetical protein